MDFFYSFLITWSKEWPEIEAPQDGPDGAKAVQGQEDDLADQGHHEEGGLLAVALELDDTVAIDNTCNRQEAFE